jgi:hypothetical protein
MKIEGVLAIANKENLNSRVYSAELLNDMAKQFEEKKPMFGELGMSSESIVSLKNASHKIISTRIKKSRLPRKKKKLLKKQGLYENWKNNNGPILFGTIELLDTKAGELAKKMFEDKTAVIRSRGVGNVNNGEVQNYSLISFDIIHKDNDTFKGLI